MKRTKNILGNCSECGASLTFPVESVGTTAQCPQCGKQAELLLSRPPEVPTISRKAVVWTVVTILILVAGLACALFALKRAENWAARHKSGNAVSAGELGNRQQP